MVEFVEISLDYGTKLLYSIIRIAKHLEWLEERKGGWKNKNEKETRVNGKNKLERRAA